MTTYSERPWFQMYDPDVAHSLEPYPDFALHHFLEESAAKWPEKEALVTSVNLPVLGRVVETVSYRRLNAESDALATALVDLGLQPGDVVALVMPNCAAFVISFYAVLKAGGVVAAANPTFPTAKLQFQIDDSDAKFAIVLSLFYDKVKQLQAGTKLEKVIVTNIKEYFPAVARILFTLAREKKEGHRIETLANDEYYFQDLVKKYGGQKPDVVVVGDDMCIYQYTGGTTGDPRAAMSLHHALVANTLQMSAVLQPEENEIFLGAIPLFHVFGMVAVVSKAIYLGGKIALVINARDIDDLLGVIETTKPTIFHGVPALYNAINNHPKVLSGEISLRCIRICVSGSAPLPPPTKREFERLCGGKLLEGFGMSEAPTASHVNPLYGENRAGSIGLPMPDMDMRIVSLEDGETDVPVGEVGELVMAGPQVMKSYHNRPQETAAAIREKDGKRWLYTGDIARMDEDGYFYIIDRKKDMALIGGFNVYPAVIEKVISEHEAVREVGVAAIPHPDKEGQEALKAWVVLHPGKSVTKQDLISHCSTYLAPYEVPTRYAFIDELPKSEVLKTLRFELVSMEMRERAQAQSQA